MGKGSGTSSRSSVKMRGSGMSLSRFELENVGLRNEFDRAVLSVKMPVSGTARPRLANPRRCQTLCVRAQPAVGGDERVEIKEIFKNDGLRNGKISQKILNGDAPERIFRKFVKMICSGTEIQGWKWGPSRAAHTQYAYIIMEVPPPPPPVETVAHFSNSRGSRSCSHLFCVNIKFFPVLISIGSITRHPGIWVDLRDVGVRRELDRWLFKRLFVDPKSCPVL